MWIGVRQNRIMACRSVVWSCCHEHWAYRNGIASGVQSKGYAGTSKSIELTPKRTFLLRLSSNESNEVKKFGTINEVNTTFTLIYRNYIPPYSSIESNSSTTVSTSDCEKRLQQHTQRHARCPTAFLLLNLLSSYQRGITSNQKTEA